MCQRAPLVPGYGTLNDLAASSPLPFGSTSTSTPLVPANSSIGWGGPEPSLSADRLKAMYADAPSASEATQGPGGPRTKDLRLEAMVAQAKAVEAKRSVGWSKLTSVIPQVQCGMAYINQTPFFNRGYVRCGLLNEAPINGQLFGEFDTEPTDKPAGSSCKTKHYSNHLGGKPTSALWWPHEWHGQEGRYGASRDSTGSSSYYGMGTPTWTSGKSAMPQYVAGRSGYMVDPWGAAHLN